MDSYHAVSSILSKVSIFRKFITYIDYDYYEVINSSTEVYKELSYLED